MAALLRSVPSALLDVLGPLAPAPATPLSRADLFSFTLLGGQVLNWTSWDSDLAVAGAPYSSKAPWLERTKWNVANTMEVPTLNVFLRAFNAGFNGGTNIKTQIHNGLFDGAGFTLSRAFMSPPGTVLGTVGLFGGQVGGIDLTGSAATIAIKGKTNLLDQYAPHNLYQIGCNHAFCDVGCTLSRAAYTASFSVGPGAVTSSFIPWATAPANAANYQLGQITMTSGLASGQTRSVASASASGLTLDYPLYETPGPGDTFTAFQGCDKTFNSGSGQSCTARSNTQNYKGYPYVPPPNSAY